MKGVSIEVLYLLLFAAFIVGQYLIQWFKRNKDKWQDDLQTPDDQQAQSPEADDLPFLRTSTPAPEQPAVAAADVPEVATRRNRPRGPVVTEQAPVHTRRRYSRDTLLGSKRRIQDAVVVAMILGPCRAQSPHDNGQ